MKETLCWTCEYCTGATKKINPDQVGTNQNGVVKTRDGKTLFQCPWAAQGVPVAGWTATPHKLKHSSNEIGDSYLVSECPCYKADLEAKIEAMSSEEIAKYLGVSPSFPKRKHKKICKQILYSYIKQYGLMLQAGKMTRSESYKARRAIVEELLEFSSQSVSEMSLNGTTPENEGTSSDDKEYYAQLQQNIGDCRDLIDNMAYHHKRYVIAKRAAADTTE